MNRAEIDTLWQKALNESIKAGEQFTRYHFADLVSDAESKRMYEEGMVTVGHMREQIAAEREACAGECDEWIKNGSALAEDIASAILARGQS